ncbi:MAG: hypothetical protein GF364_19735 [Candidatus Lokiarchaeota archaeon]|nr:hypothetical protein [Candidatus Lokiarchaeota archaeon]
MADKIKVGVIGLGRISSLHLPAYKPESNINAELVSICDSSRKKRKNIAAEYHIDSNHVYKDYKDLLSDNTIDAVEILTPHHLHHEMTIQAAKSGKHISLQKVPAMTLSEMDDMINVTKSNDVKFRVFENFRFYEPYMKTMELIQNGVIGEVDRVDYSMLGGISLLGSWSVPLMAWKWRISEKSNYRSPNVWDDGYHKHSIIAWFLPDKIESVLAWQGAYRIKGVIPVDTPTVIIYSCKNKSKYGVWNISMHDHVPMKNKYYGCDEFVKVVGSKGLIMIPGCTGSLYEGCEDGGIKEGVHWVGKNGVWKSDLNVDTDWASSFLNCSRAFIEGIRNDTEIPLIPEEARYILKIGLAILSSVRNGFREVKLKEIKDGIIKGHNYIEPSVGETEDIEKDTKISKDTEQDDIENGT